MGKLKQKLLELEDSGVIYYSDDLRAYVLNGGDPNEAFDLDEYLIATTRPATGPLDDEE